MVEVQTVIRCGCGRQEKLLVIGHRCQWWSVGVSWERVVDAHEAYIPKGGGILGIAAGDASCGGGPELVRVVIDGTTRELLREQCVRVRLV